MSELSYKELQEQGIFDVPYRTFEYMQSQQGEVDKLQTEIDELQARVDVILKACDNLRKDIIREHHTEYDKGWKDYATIVYYN